MLGSLDAAAEADLIVLDWALPDVGGIDLLPRLRQRGVNLPVVFLTSHSEIAYEDQAFGRGAIDFIDKTRGMEVLVRRLRLAVGKLTARVQPDKRIICGKLTLRAGVHRACWNEVDVGLTASEYGVVELLVSNVGRYKTCREIYDHQYFEGFIAGSGEQGYRTNVRSTIKRVRRKFCQIDPTFTEIETSYRLGYRWRGLTAASM